MRKMKKFVALILAIVALSCGWAGLAASETLNAFVQGSTADLGGPTYMWWYGCSATSAGMMIGYYDRHGYGGQSYANLVPGGAAESETTNSGSLGWFYRVTRAIASYGYVTDYYRDASGNPGQYNGGTDPGYYNNSGDDRAGAPAYNCLAYYMGTSQDAVGNANGSTSFYYYTTDSTAYGDKFYARDAYNYGVWNKDGMYGMDEYFRACGYGTGTIQTDMNFFTQVIYGYNGNTKGFTFAEYKAEIDAGRVVMIQLAGHSMFGYGYDDNGQLILFHDTWDFAGHSMTWGDSYGGMDQWGVVCFDPTGGLPVPLPSSLLLMLSGLACLAGFRKRFGKR